MNVSFFYLWFQHLVNLFARLATDNIGYIDWDPYVPKVMFFILLNYFVYFELSLTMQRIIHILWMGLVLQLFQGGMFILRPNVNFKNFNCPFVTESIGS